MWDIISSDGFANLIQVGVLIALTVTFIAILKQLVVQNSILNAQLLKDRYDMYVKTYSPVTRDEITSFKDYPEDWITRSLYEEKYKEHDDKIRRYLMISKLYEYLAFTYNMRSLKLFDLLGNQWLEKWTASLLDTEEFNDVHHSYDGYYPHFKEYVNSLRISKRINA